MEAFQFASQCYSILLRCLRKPDGSRAHPLRTRVWQSSILPLWPLCANCVLKQFIEMLIVLRVTPSPGVRGRGGCNPQDVQQLLVPFIRDDTPIDQWHQWHSNKVNEVSLMSPVCCLEDHNLSFKFLIMNFDASQEFGAWLNKLAGSPPGLNYRWKLEGVYLISNQTVIYYPHLSLLSGISGCGCVKDNIEHYYL